MSYYNVKFANALFLIIILLLSSCSTEESNIPIFSVDIAADSFVPEGGSKTVTLTSNISWSASSSDDWFTVSPNKGTGGATITMSATENNTPTTRKGVVTLTPEIGESIKISVSQATRHQFQVDVTELTFLPLRDTIQVSLTAFKTFWEVNSSIDWLTVSPEKGEDSSILTFIASPNKTSDERQVMVTLTPDVGDPIEISVIQNGVSLSTNVSQITFNNNPGEKSITLMSNVSWEALSDVDWLIIDPVSGTAGSKEKQIDLIVRRNGTTESRTASITLIPEIGESITVSVLQESSVHAGESVKYVAINAKGDGSGNNEANAADFLSTKFWERINNDLEIKSVEIFFLPGDYVKAYTSAGSGGNGLTFNRMGNVNNRLILTGGKDVVFTVPTGYSKRNTLITFHGSQNITFRDFNFTGSGDINYVLAIRTPSGFSPSKNILIENCTWTDMRGVAYGATGCHYEGTKGVTYKNCTFQRVGSGTGAHMMYHAYGPTHINVIDSHFEDCSGEYVRFRDRSDYGLVKNCTFKRNSGWIGAAFISVPNYNSKNPGTEYFGTNYSFTDNVFQDSRFGIQFRHTGFSPSDYNYLLTAEEGAIMEKGTKEEKVNLLKRNFGLDLSKIRIVNNIYPGIYDKNISFNSNVMYGAESLGWVGTVDITNIFNSTLTPFDWEEF